MIPISTLINNCINHEALSNEILKEILLLLDKEIVLSHNSVKFGNRVDSLIDFYGNFFMRVISEFFPPYLTEEDRLSRLSNSLETIKRFAKEKSIFA